MDDPPELSQLSLLLEHNVQFIATGSKDIQNTALLATQSLFNQCKFYSFLYTILFELVFYIALRSEADSAPHVNQLILSLCPLDAPRTRSQTSGKRKRSPSPPPNHKAQFQTTQLAALFVDGMSEDQLWAQIDMRTKNVCDILNSVLEEGGPLESEEEEEVDDGSESEEEETEMQDVLAAYGDVDDWSDEDSASNEENEDELLGDGEQVETIAELRDPSSDEDSEPTSPKVKLKSHKKSAKHGGHPQLDDDFFNLAAFHAEIEAAEARSSGRGRLDGSDEDEESEDEVIDMFAPIEDQSLEDSLGDESRGMCDNHGICLT
jgi:U3 small nucleolar RNA-associated protein MPP10